MDINKTMPRWISAYFGAIWGVLGPIWAYITAVEGLFLVVSGGHQSPPLATSCQL